MCIRDRRSKRANKPQGKGAVDSAPDEANVGEETLHEISADKLTDAAKAAEVKRGKAAVAGDTETAKKAIGQNKKFYDAAKAKRMKESADRMKERMIQFTKDHDNKMAGKQPI